MSYGIEWSIALIQGEINVYDYFLQKGVELPAEDYLAIKAVRGERRITELYRVSKKGELMGVPELKLTFDW